MTQPIIGTLARPTFSDVNNVVAAPLAKNAATPAAVRPAANTPNTAGLARKNSPMPITISANTSSAGISPPPISVPISENARLIRSSGDCASSTASAMVSVAPATSPMSDEAVFRSRAYSESPKSSACVPNSPTAICARSAGSSTPPSFSRTSCVASRADVPPLPIRCAMSSAFSPSASNAAAVPSEPSTARMLNSLNASATLSASRAPALRPCDIRPTDVEPSMPRLRNSVPYSVMVSVRSPALSAPLWKPLVSTSKPSSALSTMPVRISCATALMFSCGSFPKASAIASDMDVAHSVSTSGPRYFCTSIAALVAAALSSPNPAL